MELQKPIQVASAPVVFEYMKYQSFLRDYIHFKKKQSIAFSVDNFCKEHQIVSKTYLSMILHNKRKLPLRVVPLMSAALGLNSKERKYFESLVQYNHARTNNEKELFLQELINQRPTQYQANLPELGYGVLYSWHCLAILELIKLPSFRLEPRWISERFKKRISIAEVNYALRVLIETGLVSEDTKGHLRSESRAIRTSDEIRSLAIQRYHQSCLVLGAEMLRNLSIENREYGSINVALDEKNFLLAKEKIKVFREEILNLSGKSNSANANVCQLNIQLFNLER